jgi:PEGA domain
MRALAISFLLVSAAAYAKTPLAAAGGPGGTLVLGAQTPGAEVYVDGEKVGMVPLPGPLPFSPGEHTIKIVKPGFAPLIDVFTIGKRRETKFEAELVPVAGVLNITANIEKANVFIDGKFVGEAPLTTEMPVGARAVQMSKGGYKDFFQNVSAVAGQEINLDVKLEELPMGLNPYKPPPPPPPKWFEKWWVWTAAAGGVVAVVVAVTVPLVLTSQKSDPCSGSNTIGCFTLTAPALTMH